MIEQPFEAYVDGKKVEKWHVYTDGKLLVAKVLPKGELFGDLTELEEPINLFLFVTPVSDYKDLEPYISSMKGKTVNMGEMPTLKAYRQSKIQTKLEPGFYYDLFSIGTYGGDRIFAGGGRLSTQNGKVPHPMTLDELKLLAIEDLELTQEQAKKVEAKLEPMDGGLCHKCGKRVIIAGFEYGRKNSKDAFPNVGSMVQHNGVVSHYHRYSREEIRKALHV